MENEVVVTGIGVVTPVGTGTENYWDAVLKGTSGIRMIDSFDIRNCKTKFGAQIPSADFRPEALSDRNEMQEMLCRNTQLAFAATQMAFDDAGLTGEQTIYDPELFGAILGVTEDIDYYIQRLSDVIYETQKIDGIDNKYDISQFVKLYRETGQTKLKFMSSLPDFSLMKIVSDYELAGPAYTINTACSSGSQAIGDAYKTIKRGEAKLMVCGGTQSFSGPAIQMMFNLLSALSENNDNYQTASRPFDSTRDGFVLGEGAGIIILEELEHALARKAPIRGQICGYGLSCDAYRVTDEHPDGRGAVDSMNNALIDAKLEPQEIDYINAHGTSTALNDKIETMAIKKVFADHAYNIPISSSKSMTGHLIAASGAVELVTCLLAVQNGIVPPTINYRTPDPDCDLDYVPNEKREKNINTALSNSFGFGGQNCTLIVKKSTDIEREL